MLTIYKNHSQGETMSEKLEHDRPNDGPGDVLLGIYAIFVLLFHLAVIASLLHIFLMWIGGVRLPHQ